MLKISWAVASPSIVRFPEYILQLVSVTISENKKWMSPVKINKSYSFSRYILKCATFKVISHSCWSHKKKRRWHFKCFLRRWLAPASFNITFNLIRQEETRRSVCTVTANPPGVYLTQTMTRRTDTPLLLQKEALLRVQWLNLPFHHL